MGGVTTAEYKRLLTEAYDLDKPEAPELELERWMRYARAADGPVLEVMCGSGRFLLPLAAAGIDIDGTDASVDMLAACATKCRERNLSPQLTRQFAHEIDLPRRYAFAFVAAGSFGLLVDEASYRGVLLKLLEHLEPGGVLAIEVETPAAGASTQRGLWVGRWWDRPDGALIVSRDISRYDSQKRVEQGLGIYELSVDGHLVESELNNWVRRFWTPGEIEHELQDAGFADVLITALDDAVLLIEAHRPS
ncbi:MAG TPA: methyltransferase domain-containing protein [Propionibacteriaceae bacterium]